MRSGPYVARMTRVSPPELARGVPGPQASSSVTFAPRRRRNSAVQPPNAPAPTTTTFILARGDCPDSARAIDTAGSIARRERRESLDILSRESPARGGPGRAVAPLVITLCEPLCL